MKNKWSFAIGTTSRVPGKPGWHYLMLDIDGEFTHQNADEFEISVLQKTESGIHVFTPILMALSPMLRLALSLGADPAWCSIAEKRGYAFLADKAPLHIPWPVERMVIGK
jgi:hypothetical protein